MGKLIMYNNDNINALVKHLEENTISTNPQQLTEAQKAQVKENLGISDDSGANPNIINSENKKLADLSEIALGWRTNENPTLLIDADLTASTMFGLHVAEIEHIEIYPSVGDEFIVEYQNTTYYPVAEYTNFLGDNIIVGASYVGDNEFDFSEYPFCIAFSNNAVLFETDGDKGNIKIYKKNYNYKKIPEEYTDNFYITVIQNDDDSFSCDRTYTEIFNAYFDKYFNKKKMCIYCTLISGLNSVTNLRVIELNLSSFCSSFNSLGVVFTGITRSQYYGDESETYQLITLTISESEGETVVELDVKKLT